MALPDYTVEIVAENASPLPSYRVAVVLEGATPRPDFIVGSPAAGALPDFRVARVLVDATPLPDFRVAGIGIDDFRTAMPAGSTYTRAGAATGLTTAGLISSFAADAPQRTDRGLALEPAATNRAIYSTDPTSTEWNVTQASKTTGQAEPFGGTGAALVTANGVLAAHSIRSTVFTPVAYTLGQVYTLSCLVKKGTQSLIQFGGPGSAFNPLNYANFDLDTATVLGSVAVDSASILSLGNGWYRLAITMTATASASGATGLLAHIASGTDIRGSTNSLATTFYVTGAQQEAGAVASSPIVTVASAVTRALPVFTEPVPAGCSRALLTYADATTTMVTGLTPGGTFDVATAVIGAGKGAFGVSELVTRAWLA